MKRYYTPKEGFNVRLLKTMAIALLIFIFSLGSGVLGYHYIVQLDWVDAFLNSSMILGGMGQVSELKSNGEKIFAGCYALFSGVAFLTSVAIFVSPIIHRFLRRFHLELE